MPGVKTAAFVTLGCKINQYETEAIREEVLDLGYREVSHTEAADVYVVNTCSVTATSGVKSRRHVLRAARRNPAARIIVVGCSTPSEKAKLADIPQVAVLAGNEEKAMVADFLAGGPRPEERSAADKRDIFSLKVSRYTHRTRPNVKVQDGCNNFCSFCIIPFLRGRSTSRQPDAVVDEVRRLVDAGNREVVVTGVHLQDYGTDLDPYMSLAELFSRVAEVEGLDRIRMSSVNPRAFTPELIEVLTRPPFCPHWHIPLQAGSDHALGLMRRDYDMDCFRRLVGALHERVERPSIATDVIVGHPGETEEDFAATLERCEEFGFSKVHVFPFSSREGTLAAKLGGHLPVDEVRRRAALLRELDDELANRFRASFDGEMVEVLVEGSKDGLPASMTGPGGPGGSGEATPERLAGLTERYVRVEFGAPSPTAGERFPGTLQPVRIERVDTERAHGRWVGEIVE